MTAEEILSGYVPLERPRYKVGDYLNMINASNGCISRVQIASVRSRRPGPCPWVYEFTNGGASNECYLFEHTVDHILIECPACERKVQPEDMADYLCQECR